MSFKKKIVKKNNFVLNIVGSITIFLMLFLGVYTFSAVNSLNLSEKKVFETTNSSGEIITETTSTKKEINVLLVGRPGDGKGELANAEANLTDSLILAKINSEKKSASLLSIPRDLWVVYPDKNEGEGKLNSIFSHYRIKNLRKLKYTESLPEDERIKIKKEAEKEAIGKLAEKIEEITGESVDFYINVDFTGFIDIIDTIGGVEIDVHQDLIDREYPSGWGYQTISFKKGLQTMNGSDALKYARSRKSTTDYDRSLRQQQIIEGVKNKFKKLNLAQALDLYGVLSEKIVTDISLEDAKGIIINFGVLQEKYSFVSSNFNDTCYSTTSECEKGGILYIPVSGTFGNHWANLIRGTDKFNLSNYDLSKKYSNIVLNYPKISEEKFEINILNASGTSGVAGNFVNKMRKYGFDASARFIANSPEKYDKSIIYYNGIGKSDTLDALKELFKGDFEELQESKFPEAIKNNKEERKVKIEIIIGKDYKDVFNF